MEWSDDYENILENIRINSVFLNKAHQRSYFYYKKLSKYFTIPTIILSSFNSVFSVGFIYTSSENVSSISALISLLVSIINSVMLFLKIEDNMDLESEKSKQYYQLSSDIFKILQLNRNHRKNEPNEILEKFYNRYIELLNQSNIMNNNLYNDKLLILPKTKSIFNKFKLKENQKIISSSASSIQSEENDTGSPKIIINPIENI